MERERVTEIFTGLALIVFLILLVFLVMGVSGYNYKTTGTAAGITTNSYNVNSYNQGTTTTNSFNAYPSQALPATTAYTTTATGTYAKPKTYTTKSTTTQKARTTQYTTTYAKPYIVDNRDSYSYNSYYSPIDKKYDYRYDYTKSTDYQYQPRYLGYDDFGNFRAYEGIVGNRVDSYNVYVRNREYVGGYFKAVFYFEDYYGNVDSESMTYYIPAGEEKTFVYRDVSPPKYKNMAWNYKVESLTKIPAQPGTYSYSY